jgi:hypothetical protein
MRFEIPSLSFDPLADEHHGQLPFLPVEVHGEQLM